MHISASSAFCAALVYTNWFTHVMGNTGVWSGMGPGNILFFKGEWVPLESVRHVDVLASAIFFYFVNAIAEKVAAKGVRKIKKGKKRQRKDEQKQWSTSNSNIAPLFCKMAQTLNLGCVLLAAP